MNSQELLHADVLDIIFEGRNKAYGAYQLRRTYYGRLMLSVAGTLTFAGLFLTGWLLAGGKEGRLLPAVTGPDYVLDRVVQTKKVELPAKPPLKPPQTASRQYTRFRLVQEDIPESARPPERNELDNVRIGLETHTGENDRGIVPTVTEDSRGIVAVPEKKESPDSTFIIVQMEAQYPGGMNAWAKYLQKNLENNYPHQAMENGIQGEVVIQFIVDRDGNVSDVSAASGPDALQQAAITVIRRSGRWTPAIQNGRKVRSWKRQPIVFRLADE